MPPSGFYITEFFPAKFHGLPDFLKCGTAGQCKAWINTGSGWQRNDNWKPPAVISHWNGTKNIDNGVRIVDEAPTVSHCK
jgi:hypothetical protein